MKNQNSKTQTPGTASDVLRILSENRKKKSRRSGKKPEKRKQP
ncbi:MAG: hypothetical protein Q4D76_09935 [Oscillospiraceae bacterium]|nr:hypothetical protein [Oscillospiraceae bacterium]